MQFRRRSDKELVVAKLLGVKKGSLSGLRGIPVEDKYYVPDHFTPLDISTELGNFELTSRNLAASGLVLLLAWWLYRRYS